MSHQGQRCCDGCFNRLRYELEEQKKRAFLESIKPLDSRSAQKQYAADRGELLGVGSEAKREPASASASVASTASVLSEAGERLRERGERLEKLSDKTDKLANASSEFAKLATQLRQQQQQRNSWW
jgi:hypothetical protein